MELTHTSDDGLSCFFVCVCFEGWVFLSQFCKSNTHLFLTSFCLRLDCYTDNRFWEFHGFEDDWVFWITQGITGSNLLNTYCSCDIACVASFDIFSVVSMHLKDTTHSFCVAFGCVENSVAGVNNTRVYTEEAEFTYEWVGCNLECKSCKRSIIGRWSVLFFFSIKTYTFDIWDIGWCWHVVNDSIQKFLNTLVFIGSTTADWNHSVSDGINTDCVFDFFDGQFLTIEVFFHQFFILLADGFDHLCAVFFCLVFHVVWNVNNRNVLAQIIVVNVSFHFNEVDQTFEECFSTDWQLNRNSITFQTVMDHVQNIVEVCTHDIHLVNVDHSWNMIFISLAPNSLRLWLNSAFSTHYCYRTVENSQGTLYLYCKVNVSRSINDVDTMVFPVAGCSSGSNGNTSLLLLYHPVHRCATIMSFTDFVVNTGVVQNTLCCGSFTSIDVRHYADVTSHS